MSRTNQLKLIVCLATCPAWLTGCSQPAPDMIEGKTPADYREEAEKRLARPISSNKVAPASTKSK